MTDLRGMFLRCVLYTTGFPKIPEASEPIHAYRTCSLSREYHVNIGLLRTGAHSCSTARNTLRELVRYAEHISWLFLDLTRTLPRAHMCGAAEGMRVDATAFFQT